MEFPNLELLVYRAKLMLQNDEEFKKRLLEKYPPEYDVVVFPQTWGSTALGFDSEFGGQAMTKAYTTVVHEITTGTFVVFFGDRPAYKVCDINDVFKKDFEERTMKSVSEAIKYY